MTKIRRIIKTSNAIRKIIQTMVRNQALKLAWVSRTLGGLFSGSVVFLGAAAFFSGFFSILGLAAVAVAACGFGRVWVVWGCG